MGTSIYPFKQASAADSHSRLLSITHSRYENDWHSQPHIHPFTELFYVKDGAGSFLVEEQEYAIQKDDFVIVNAGISHTEISSASVPLEYVSIAVEGFAFSRDAMPATVCWKLTVETMTGKRLQKRTPGRG